MTSVEVSQSIHLLSFGGGNRHIRAAVRRILHEARVSNFFVSVNGFTEKNLYKKFPDLEFEIESLNEKFPKGYGLFVWKILLIQKLLESIPEGAILLYLDAGCTINIQNSTSAERFQSYLNLTMNQGILAFQLKNGQFGDQTKFREEFWSTTELMDFLDLSIPDRISNQIESGVIFLKNTSHIRNFVSEWLRISRHSDYEFIREKKIRHQGKLVGENRHDQSVFSCLYKAAGHTPLLNETYFAGSWEIIGQNSPIWTTRNRSGVSHAPRFSDIPELVDLWVGRQVNRIKSKYL
jgi:hypothetical protein